MSLLAPLSVSPLGLRIRATLCHIPGYKALSRWVWHPKKAVSLEREVFGIKFSNPVGLAAGVTAGDYADILANYGFGFIEVGSLSVEPQAAPHAPMVTRLPREKGVVYSTHNANKGVKHAIECLKNYKPNCKVAANLVPALSSRTEEQTIKEIRTAFMYMYDFVDFFVINMAAIDNDDQLLVRDLDLMSTVLDELIDLRMCYGDYRPILVKISPDFSNEFITRIVEYCQFNGIDGIVAGGSSLSREGLRPLSQKLIGHAGNAMLSGGPLFKRMLEVVGHVNEVSKGRLPVIACGGIMTPAQAQEALQAGASLVEINSGLHFKGPRLVKNICKHIQ